MTSEQRPVHAKQLPLWGAVLIAWAAQLCWPAQGDWPLWRPELLLVIMLHLSLRCVPWQGALWGLGLGWLEMALTARPSPVLLLWWVALGAGCAWLRTQWDTERRSLFVALSWMAVMAWHTATWLAKSSHAWAPPRWTFAFLFAQTVITFAVAALWERYGPRCIRLPAIAGASDRIMLLHGPRTFDASTARGFEDAL